MWEGKKRVLEYELSMEKLGFKLYGGDDKAVLDQICLGFLVVMEISRERATEIDIFVCVSCRVQLL